MMKRTPAEIHDQYAALQRTVGEVYRRTDDFLSFYREAHPKALICIGCGSSYMLGKSMAAIARDRLDIPAYAMAAGDLWLNAPQYRALIEGSMVLVLSRSGATSEVIHALDALGAQGGFTLASIVCAQGSQLEGRDGFCLRLPWAFDESVCQTRCVTNMYAAGAMLIAAINGPALEDDFAAVARAGDGFIADNEARLAEIAAQPWERVLVLADGAIEGIAEEGALAFNEICQLPSNFYHILDVRHGPMVLAREGTLAVVMLSHVGHPQERRLIDDLIAKGVTVVACAPGPMAVPGTAHVAAAPLTLDHAALGALYISVCQLLSYHKSTVNGADPDAPTGLSAWIKL